MSRVRRAEARWDAENKRWVLDVQRDGERRKFSSSTPKTAGRREVEAMADKWLESGCKDMRLQVAYDLFEEHIRDTRNIDQYRLYQWAMTEYILPSVGAGKKLSQITPGMWQGALDYAAKHGLARASVSSVRGCIVAFLKYARRNRWDVERLEDGDLYMPVSLPPTPEKQILTPGQLRTLFEDDTVVEVSPSGRKRTQVHDWYIHLYRFAVATGMRRGELIGLRTDDISPDGRIHIQRAIRHDGVETGGKTANARRTFQLTSVAMAVLSDQREMLQSAGVISPLVFPSRTGLQIQPAVLTRYWIRYRDQHGFDGVSLHCLRHTFISLLKSDVPLTMIKSTVGHSRSMATLGIYGHEVSGDTERAAELTDAVFKHILA